MCAHINGLGIHKYAIITMGAIKREGMTMRTCGARETTMTIMKTEEKENEEKASSLWLLLSPRLSARGAMCIIRAD